ncbi:putative DNA-binding transcriptional regulator AlpA [Serratia sp. 2723]
MCYASTPRDFIILRIPVVFQAVALLAALTHPSHLPKSKFLGMSKLVTWLQLEIHRVY